MNRSGGRHVGFQAQTAIRGVVSVTIINLVARVAAYGIHLVITAYIGLTAQLDAYYVALTVLSVFVLAFGDAFDFLGIPRLVRTLQEEGEDSFRRFAGSILSFAVILGSALCLLLIAAAPWTTWIAPGFPPEKKGYVLRNLLYLIPMAFIYLPYHAMGSFLRAKRRFKDFYFGELIIASAALVMILLGRDFPYIIPASYSAAYVVVLLYIVVMAYREFRLSFELLSDKMRDLYRMFIYLLPLYFSSHLYALVDRAFASYLPTGGIAALSYGLMIALLPRYILMIDNVFMTPLSETRDRGGMMSDIVNGVIIITIPLAFFTTAHAPDIIKAALERGMFTAASTQMTGEALTYFAIAIPAFFVWPLCYRLFQIVDRMGAIGVLTVVAVVMNLVLNWTFMKMNMGIKGLAIATAVANYCQVGGAFVMLGRFGIPIITREVRGVFLVSLGISILALAGTWLIPLEAGTTPGLVVHGVAFLVLTGLMFVLAPNKSIRDCRETVFREMFPAKK